METLTFNKIDNWLKTSSLWLKINTMPEARFRRYTTEPNGNRYPYCNIIYWQLGRELQSICGKNEFKMYEHYNLFTGEKLEQTKIHSSGPTIYIHTSISIFNYGIEFSIQGIKQKLKQWDDSVIDVYEKHYSIKHPRSNQPITKDLIKQFVLNYVQTNILYPEGKFRDVQEAAKLDRQTFKEFYRKHIPNLYSPDTDYDFEEDEDLAMILQRRYNVYPDYWVSEWQEAAKKCRVFVEINGKPGKPRPIVKVDYSNLLDGFDGDIDQIEDLLDERMEDYPENAILI